VVVIVILVLIWLWLRRHPKEKDDSRFLTRTANAPPITQMITFEHRPYQRINRASTGLMQRINPGALKEVVQAAANFTLTATPSSLTVAQGSSVTTTITINKQKG